jgi:deoxyribodipyrimidine photolyase-related protein
MKKIFVLFPNNLFEDVDLLKEFDEIILVEEFLFFNQYNFHKQKLVFHRASMKYYHNYLIDNSLNIKYIEAHEVQSDIQVFISKLDNVSEIHYYDVCDNWLEKRISKTSSFKGIKAQKHISPLFLNSEEELVDFFKGKKRFYQTDFYIHQRKKRQILTLKDQKPIGGKWSFDAENRLKYPKNKIAPKVNFPSKNSFYREAILYVQRHFEKNIGEISETFTYPTTYKEAVTWVYDFLNYRFAEFGVYEDAIVSGEIILNHSMLTPVLNSGLITPDEILGKILVYYEINEISLNSLEGLVRQIIGWREFIRAVYLFKGTEERTKNFWNFKRKIPQSFYDGSTGILPLDDTIKKVLKTGYCHHIERLMILGNFMLLCEFDPGEVYRWFMEMFIDSYDWVMVPNVYGMSQFADGGLMATKPYISGSSYILKMSDYKKGKWCEVWDALFWNFMDKNRDFFLSNPRLGMLIKTFDKMEVSKRNNHLKIARKYLQSLE